MSSKPLIKESLLLLNICGLNPFSQNVWSKIKTCMFAAVLAVLLVELAMEAICHSKDLEVLLPVGGVVTIQLAMHRLVILIINRKRILELLDHLQNFMFLHISKDLINFYGAIQKSYQYRGRKVMKYSTGVSVVVTTFVFLTPVVLPIKRIAFPLYHYTTKSPYFEIYNIFLFLGCIDLILFLLTFEFLFTSFVVYFLCELKTLKQEVKTIICSDEQITLKRLELFMNRHNLVLRSIKDMNAIYSGLFLNQLLSTAIGLCGSFIGIGNEKQVFSSTIFTDWIVAFAFFVNFLVCLSELFACCMGGTLLNSECEEISIAAYESQWWIKTQPKLRKSLILVIQRAQKENALTAVGVFPMNFECFASVLKMAFSIYSVAQSFRKN